MEPSVTEVHTKRNATAEIMPVVGLLRRYSPASEYAMPNAEMRPMIPNVRV